MLAERITRYGKDLCSTSMSCDDCIERTGRDTSGFSDSADSADGTVLGRTQGELLHGRDPLADSNGCECRNGGTLLGGLKIFETMSTF